MRRLCMEFDIRLKLNTQQSIIQLISVENDHMTMMKLVSEGKRYIEFMKGKN